MIHLTRANGTEEKQRDPECHRDALAFILNAKVGVC